MEDALNIVCHVWSRIVRFECGERQVLELKDDCQLKSLRIWDLEGNSISLNRMQDFTKSKAVFKSGEILGYHRNVRFLRDISSELNIPKSAQTPEAKRQGPTSAVKRNTEKLYQTSETVVSIITIYMEAYFLGFQNHSTMDNPLDTESNHASRLRWCKALRN
ncbi:hypothetical protein TNCV_2460671 [Trichonephila clavipes]|nr:hypothetical protein TNCV_2460671 [Trichonephila clavipes]